jgi:hypothetical protein
MRPCSPRITESRSSAKGGRAQYRSRCLIYGFDPAGRPPLFVGQQVEVFIDAAK